MNPGSFAGIARRTTIESQRRATYVLAASNASFPIPSWAQGGKGIVYVTGCGAGGSGGISTASGTRGTGGGGGAIAFRVPLIIPSGQATANAVIGAAGAAVSVSFGTNGNNGGQTSLTIGSMLLTLGGGRAGQFAPSSNAATGGFVNAQANLLSNPGNQPGRDVIGATNADSRSAAIPGASLGLWGSVGDGQTFGAGASSIFGIGGDGLANGPTVNTNGANATGYGAGGAGALWVSDGAVTSGAGAPGLLILEFVEGV